MKRTTPGAIRSIREANYSNWIAPEPRPLWRRIVYRMMGVE